MKYADVQRMRAIAKELKVSLSAEELDAIWKRYQLEELPKHSPLAGYDAAPATKYYKAPSKTPYKSHEQRMEEGSMALLNALAVARKGKTPRTSSKLLWSSNTGLDANGSLAPEEYPDWEYQPVERGPLRDPCPRCGTRGDIGCKHRPLA